MNYQAGTTYDEKLINEAALLYCKKSYMRVFLFSVVLTIFAILNMFVLDSKTWLSGTFLAVSISACVIFISAFFIYRNRSRSVFRQMGGADVSWVFSEESFKAESGAGNSEIKWNFVSKLIKSNSLWLIVYKNDSYSVFPLKDVTSEVLEYISSQVIKNGGKIT
ncbi:hypothetical protein MNBD_UNCLBAC01-998 [hydrothermal vent metagenome]|uniref:Uncharacterized protein n=1 Tax=hydrothermal vent metagenome TaxID=652676 RepID=A0A3B1CZM2_9ZZZZ